MSFKNAKACFDQNVTANMDKTDQDSVHCWNLNRGLHNLTVALEKDFETLNDRLERLERLLEQKMKTAA